MDSRGSTNVFIEDIVIQTSHSVKDKAYAKLPDLSVKKMGFYGEWKNKIFSPDHLAKLQHWKWHLLDKWIAVCLGLLVMQLNN